MTYSSMYRAGQDATDAEAGCASGVVTFVFAVTIMPFAGAAWLAYEVGSTVSKLLSSVDNPIDQAESAATLGKTLYDAGKEIFG